MLLRCHVVLLLMALLALCASAGGMMRRERHQASALRTALENVLAGDAAKRLFAVEEVLKPTFEAFPKNSAGKIALQALHSMARGYFAEEHGWLLNGFEFVGPRSTKLSDATLLREKSPDLVSAFEEAESKGEGLSLSDTVAAVAAVEHLVLEESRSMLERAYQLNEVPLTSSLHQTELEEVMVSYLMLFRDGKRHNVSTPKEHQSEKHKLMLSEDWDMLDRLRGLYRAAEQDIIQILGPRSEWVFSDVYQIIKDIALRYGQFQDHECEEMKTALLQDDKDGTGRIALGDFHAQPKNPHYSFTETAEYLREIGSLDESDAGSPKVLIANYLASPSNCIAWSKYISVCCLNECERLVNKLESQVQTSDVPVQKLLDTVGELSSQTVGAPRKLPKKLVDMLTAVAGVHGGVVPLQSGDFRRWFHFAFPNECTFPTDLEANQADSVRDDSERWLGSQATTTEAPVEVGPGADL